MRVYLTCNIYVSTEIGNRNLFVTRIRPLISPEIIKFINNFILTILKGSISINGPNYAGEF